MSTGNEPLEPHSLRPTVAAVYDRRLRWNGAHRAPLQLMIGCIPLFACLFLIGCQMADTGRSAKSDQVEPNIEHSGEITPAGPAYRAWRPKPKTGTPGKTEDTLITEGDILQLPKLVVEEKGFADYGFSIITNEDVLHGKPVKWVQIGVVIPGSIADQHRLTTGTKIVAIDNMPVTDLIREDLVQLLFEREPGDHVRLLVVSRKFGLLPMFVDLGEVPPPTPPAAPDLR